MRANLGQKAGQRVGEGGLVTVLDRGLEGGVQLVELGSGRVVDPELAPAEDPDDHDLSPSCGSSARPGRSETGSPAGCACCWGGSACWGGSGCCDGVYWGGGGGAYGPCCCCDCWGAWYP